MPAPLLPRLPRPRATARTRAGALLLAMAPVLVTALAPRAARAQYPNIAVHLGSYGRTATPGSRFVLPVEVDLAQRGTLSLASLQGGLQWDASRLRLDSVRVAAGSGFELLTNEARVASGRLSFGAYGATPLAASGTLLNLYFAASLANGGTSVRLTSDVAGDESGNSILPQLRSAGTAVCVASPAIWGDVTGDNSVTVADAQQVARYSIALSVGSFDQVAAQGDVTADGIVNVLDAQQLLRYATALPAASRIAARLYRPDVSTVTLSPSTPITLEVGRFRSLDVALSTADGSDVSGCEPVVSWTSSNPTVASVLMNGVITGMGTGTTTLTVSVSSSSGIKMASVNVTVVPTTGAVPVLVSVQRGADHTCALTAAGRPYCWGSGDQGRLGTGTESDRLNPGTPVSGGRNFLALAVQGFHSCALTAAGAAWCWGGNLYGQLGDGTQSNRSEPVPVVGGLSFVSLATGAAFHTCGIAGDGTTRCWGNNLYGQLGDGSVVNKSEPTVVPGSSSFAQLATGAYHTCALDTAGTARCWGYNIYGQVGDGSYLLRSSPTVVAGGRSYTSLVAGSAHTCGLATGGGAWCWGSNLHGQLGIGSGSPTLVAEPTRVAGDLAFVRLTAGSLHTCGLVADGTAYCWGDNNDGGPLGDGTEVDRYSPTPVSGGLLFSAISAGGASTCAVTRGAATLWCWGKNLRGQLGDGTTTNRPLPTAVQVVP